ncbi:hypothetical protein Tco_0369951 [Tanacetum coccineum]
MDSIISLGQNNTLVEYMILSGADNRPPMLDKDLYDSWKSRMELYMQNREHRRMILESVENGPLIWPTVKENGLPANIYSLKIITTSYYDLWERVSDTMHMYLSLTKQERECFAVLVFSLGDDPIACLNKAMAFLTAIDDEETLILKEESHQKLFKKAEDPEVIAKKISHKPIDYEKLNSLTDDFGKCFSPQQELSAEQAFWFHTFNPTIEPSYTPPVIMDVPSELPKVSLVNASLKKLKFHLTQFDSMVKKRTTPSALEEEYFEINDLKARLQDKDTTICKLKDTIKSLRENTKEENVNHDKWEIEPINKELENSVAKFLYQNERLFNEINHVKQVFKDQFDSIKQTRVRHKEQRKEIVENVVHIPSATTISPGMFKLDLVPLPPRLMQNREAHIDYIRNTQEQANILREIVEQAKAKQPLDGELDLACNTKKVAVTPMNNVKIVRFVEPLTSSSNIKEVESSNTSDSNTPVLSFIGVKCSTSNCGSKPPGNKKNDRVSQTPNRNKKNKVEAQPRKVNKSNHVVKPVCDVDVKHSLSNTNSEILCAT